MYNLFLDMHSHVFDVNLLQHAVPVFTNKQVWFPRYILGKNRMITLDKQGREIQEQDNIMARIEEFYSELFIYMTATKL